MINDFLQGVKILESLGCRKKYYLEKFRETWNLGNTEIVIDSLPGTPEYAEIESNDEKEIIITQKILGLNESGPEFRKYDLYNSEYGISSDKIIIGDVRFDNAIKKLEPMLQMNKDKFRRVIEQQLNEQQLNGSLK